MQQDKPGIPPLDLVSAQPSRPRRNSLNSLDPRIRKRRRRNAIMVTVDDDDGPDSPKNLLNHMSLVPTPAMPDKVKRLQVLLGRHPIISRLAPDCLNRVLNEFMLTNYNRGDIIFRKEEQDDKFYVVEKGFCHDPEHLDLNLQLGIGACFGDVSLVHPASKKNNLVALCELSLWNIDGSLYRFMASSHSILQFSKVKEFIESNAKRLELHLPRDISLLADFSSLVEIKNGDNVFHAVLPNSVNASEYVFFVHEGQLRLETVFGVAPADQKVLGPGAVFGETLLPTFVPGRYTATPLTEWVSLVATRTQVYMRLPHLRTVLMAAAASS